MGLISGIIGKAPHRSSGWRKCGVAIVWVAAAAVGVAGAAGGWGPREATAQSGNAEQTPTTTTTTPPVTIGDDDEVPNVSVADVSVVEGAGDAVVVFTLSAPSGRDVRVEYGMVDGEAVGGSDFTSVAGSVTVVAGAVSGWVSVVIADDELDEVDESFTVEITGVTNAVLDADDADSHSATVTIEDDDDAPYVSVADITASEGGGFAVVEFTLSAPSGRDVAVDFRMVDGEAVAGFDYLAVEGSVPIAAGRVRGAVWLYILEDASYEEDETFTVEITGATNAVLDPDDVGSHSATVTIEDDDVAPVVSTSDVSVGEDAGSAEVVFSLSGMSPDFLDFLDGDVTVSYSTVEGSALADTSSEVLDFAPVASGEAVIPRGDTSVSVAVTVNNDTLDEADETFTVTITGVTNAVLDSGGHSATVTIGDDDEVPNVSVADVSVVEGAGDAVVVFTLSAPSGRDVTVEYGMVDGEAAGGSDYTSVAGSVTIAAGEASGAVSVAVADDELDEADETFTVTIAGVANASLDPDDASSHSAVVTIEDDDDPPNVSISGMSVSEGAYVARVVFTLDAVSGRDVAVDFRTVDGEAVAGFDYLALDGSARILAGNLSRAIVVYLMDDAFYEQTETFTVEITGVTNATLNPDDVDSHSATVAIEDTDVAPVVSVADVSVGEDAGSAAVVFSLSPLFIFNVADVTVSYSTVAGSALADTSGEVLDFAPVAAGEAVIPWGDASVSVAVTVNDDTLDEADETFTVTITGVTHAVLDSGSHSATVTIEDNDSAPNVSVADVSVGEDAGSAEVVFTLDAVSGRDVVVEYRMVDGEAAGGSDYTSVAGSVTIAAGQASGAVAVAVTDDELDEADETFTVTITGVTNAALDPDDVGGHSATVTIEDNDSAPNVSVADVSVGEGAGSADVVFSLSAPSGRDVTVTYSTVEGSALGDTADDVLDFVPVVSGEAVISAGEVSVPVTVNDDSVHEADETFTVTITAVTNAVLDPGDVGGHSATVTIEDDDALTVAFAQSVVTVSEGSLEVVVSVSFSPVPERRFELVFSTGVGVPDAGVVAGSQQAVAGDDYIAVDASTVAVAAGDATVQLRVALRDDLIDETDTEWLVVSVSADPADATVPSAPVVVLIADDDSAPYVSVADVSVGEDAGSAAVVFSLSAPSGRDVTVTYSTVEGTALGDTSKQDLDFAPVAAGEAVVAAGERSVSVPVAVNDDSVHEPDEAFTVSITGATNAALDPNDTDGHSATVTIEDDDAVAVSWSAPVLFVGESAGEAVISVSVSPVPERSVELVYTTDLPGASRAPSAPRSASSSPATHRDDYTRVAPTAVAVAAGEGSVELRVAIVDDTIDETDTEWFLVWLSADSADVAVPLTPATIFIADNDDPPTVSVADASVSEDAASVEVVFTLDGPSGRDITVNYATTAGTALASTATEDLDYGHATGSLTIIAGTTTATAAVAINDDTVVEADETFTVDITGATDATVDADGDSATITITDNDGPKLSVTDLEVDESTATQANTARFEVTLSPASTGTVTVQYATSDDNAQHGLDYTAASGTLTFEPGDTTAHIDVAILHDDLDEHDETLTVTLTTPTNAALDRAAATATIIDDDNEPAVSITADSSTPTSEGGDTSVTITLDTASGRAVTVTITPAGSGTHHADSDDYTLDQQEVTLEPGTATATVTVTANQDTLDEHDETLTLTIGADHATTHTDNNTATITIADDDNAPNLTATAAAATEGTTATVTLALSAASGKTITVQYSIINITTTSDDYTHTPAQITITPGTTSTTIDIDINDDTTHEGTEFFMLQLSQTTNVNTATGTLVTILANDTP